MEVSVIIPTHNRHLKLCRACESVLYQTSKPREIIVIDDASKINVKEFIEKLSNPEIEIKVERFEIPQGVSRARNRGAQIASGDILMFLDDDDTWEPTKISDQLSVFARNPAIELVYSGRLIVKEGDREKVLYKITPHIAGNIYPKILYENYIGVTSSAALRKSLFLELGGFDESIPCREDYDLWIRCCQKTTIGHDGSCNVRYTLSDKPNSQLSGQIEIHIESFHKLCNKYSQVIAELGIIQKRKILASLLFFVAKTLRRHSLIQALPWITRSFFQYPNLKVLVLLLPVKTIGRLRSLFSSRS
jgi:glycosyltransferase involved in cell wall biosynthesis